MDDFLHNEEVYEKQREVWDVNFEKKSKCVKCSVEKNNK